MCPADRGTCGLHNGLRRDPVEVACGYGRAGAQLIHVVDPDGRGFFMRLLAIKRCPSGSRPKAAFPSKSARGCAPLGETSADCCAMLAQYVIVRDACGRATRGTCLSHCGVRRTSHCRDRRSRPRSCERGVGLMLHYWMHSSLRDSCIRGRQTESTTDITRDGRLEGLTSKRPVELGAQVGLRVTASGGVSSLEDIARLRELEPDGVDSVIVGKALYEARFTLESAIAEASPPNR